MVRAKKNILLSALLFLSVSTAFFAQVNSKFAHLTIQDGLSHSTVFALLQDKKGFMWFGTQDGGLNRYDGYDFVVYTHDPHDPASISTNNISKIARDNDGNIWIGTWGGGLDKFDPVAEKFTHYRHNEKDSNSLSHDNAQSVFVDSKNNVWVGTAGGGLNKLDQKTGKFTVFKNNPNDNNSISHDRIWSITEDKNGMLWIGTHSGLNKFDPLTGKFTRFMFEKDKKGGIAHPKVRCVYVDKDNQVWIGTTDGIDLLDAKTAMFEHFSPYPKDKENQETNEVNVIFQDHLGRMWTGTHAGGLSLFDKTTKVFKHYLNKASDPYSLSYNDVRDICEDRSDLLWVSTRGGAINMLDLKPAKFLHLKSETDEINSLQSNRVKSIATSPGGIVWIGTDGGGLSRYDKKINSFKHYQNNPADPATISSNRIRTVHADKKGNVWVGTDGGSLNFIDGVTGKLTRIASDPDGEQGPGDDDVLCVAAADNDNLWLGTDNGLDFYNASQKTFTHFRNNPADKNSLSNNRVWCVYPDSKGIVWVGTDDGLNSFDPSENKFVQYKNDNDDDHSISNNDIFCINEDDMGDLWIGTGRGLNYFDRAKGKFSNYTDRQGLPGNAIYSVQQGAKGFLWISTINGLSQFDLNKKIFRNYFTNDGLQSDEFNPGSGCRGDDGVLYFGGNNGFNFFNPELVRNNTYIPEIAFTNFTLFNKHVGIGDDSPLKNSITFTNSITLQHSQSVFGFTFAALNFTVPEENQYKYKMEGFDKEWVEIGNRREVSYTNLSPGKYTFRVKASNNDGVWNEEGIAMKIIITPPFWRTTWFYILCALTAAGLIFLYIKWRESRLRKEKKILEDKVEERTEKIKHQNEELEVQKEELSARNRDITDSIRYAKRIQEAILPPMHNVVEYLRDHFVLYRPKDIVSGDFYWVEKTSAKHAGRRPVENEVQTDHAREMKVKDPLAFNHAYRYADIHLVAAVDCTGHGVPGALVSIVGCNGLNRTVNEFGLSQPALILEKLNDLVVESLHQIETEVKDGMDITICAINWDTLEIQFAGANNPLYIVSKNENKFPENIKREKIGDWILFEIKGDKQAVGGKGDKKKVFTNHVIKMEKGETIYLFSDGYADQFGGERGKKFKYAALKELLLSMQEKEMHVQKQILNDRFDEWKGDLEQVDDICILGFRI